MSKNNLNQNFSENYHKGSCVEFFLSRGIPSCNTTHQHLGETSLIFIQSPIKEINLSLNDESVETMIRNVIKYK
jgi:hypothetical protein